MRRKKSPGPLPWLRIVKPSLLWIARKGRRPWLVAILALAACTDSLMPVLPAELFAFALMVLQPERRLVIALGFALASATSAVLLAGALGGAFAWLGLGTLMDTPPETGEAPKGDFREASGDFAILAQTLLREGGLPALWMLALLSTFPDTPRAAVALATLLGLAPSGIFAAVLAGKTALYLILLSLMHQLLPLQRAKGSPRWLRRPRALQRWLLREQSRHANTGRKRLEPPAADRESKV